MVAGRVRRGGQVARAGIAAGPGSLGLSSIGAPGHRSGRGPDPTALPGTTPFGTVRGSPGERDIWRTSVRRLLISLALAGSLVAVAAPAVFAHECVIASRSAQGDRGALHSDNWFRLGLADVFGFINGEVGGPALTADQITWAVGEAIRQGLPADGWVTRADKTIGEGSNNPNLANGKGLDHLADSVGAQIVGIYFAALGH
jgi:hypothetical protein